MKAFFKSAKVIAPVFVLILFALWLIGHKMALDCRFSGNVQHVTYSEKHIPTVTIKGVEYELGYNRWGHYNKDTIEVGDSMVKKKGELYIKLIKRHP